MMPWFIWKGKNSLNDYGLWIKSLPKRVRPEERHEEIEIPGRAGSLLMLEGEDVYSSYSAEMVVIARDDINIDKAVEWLRGSGDLILWNDIGKARTGRIVGEVAFERVNNCWMEATIPFFFQPFRKSVGSDVIQFSGTGIHTLFNPGDVASKPDIGFTGTGTVTFYVNGAEMEFSNCKGNMAIDCDAQLIRADASAYDSTMYYYVGEYATSSGNLYMFTSEGIGSSQSWIQIDGWDGNTFTFVWPGSYTGEFFKFQTGENQIYASNNSVLRIDPRWRWL